MGDARMSSMSAPGVSIVETARRAGLDAGLLYDTVIELADEGLLTAGCVNAAAGILLTELGLPPYFFEHISKAALKGVLRSIATHMRDEDGRFILVGEVAEAPFTMDGGVLARVATEETRGRMEAILDPAMFGRRVEYYFAPERNYSTYIFRPDPCPELDGVAAGASPFAFARRALLVPEETKRRYEAFLRRQEKSVTPLVEVSASTQTRETRVMFQDDFPHSPLPVVRKLFAEAGVTLNRAYWETYRGPGGAVESVCSLYLAGAPKERDMGAALGRLRSLLALGLSPLRERYLSGDLSFEEYAFAVNAAVFVHNFIHKDFESDREIVESLDRQALRDGFARRVFEANRAEYTRETVDHAIAHNSGLVRQLFEVFDRKLNPRFRKRPGARWVAERLEAFRHRAAIHFIDDTTGCDVFTYMTRFVAGVLKTNFYRTEKRAFAFRLGSGVLDPIVFPLEPYGVFLVVGRHAVGSHMRARDVARGGLRLIRVTESNYETELDYSTLLNYALGVVAQRLKHKDIAESGAKGVIVPDPAYAREGAKAVFDYADGLLDLMLPSADTVDGLGEKEMLFFGPDEGTAGFMDVVADRGRERGYRHWRTLTTGKSIGVPHDTYGLTREREVFGLIPRGEEGTELQVEGETVLVTPDTGEIYERLDGRIDLSGMTTTGVMACLRALLGHLGMVEEDAALMMTGGPDGDLGANQIQSYEGRVSLIVDGGSVLFDPKGLDRRALTELALARHTVPRLNSLAYPERLLGKAAFRAPRASGAVALPGGRTVDDGAFFHRHFLEDTSMRDLVKRADIQVFVPCGGFRDTIHAGNVHAFLELFAELRVIVEGANVFFDDTAREVIARETDILQIRDSSANKGGVTCSAIAEVLAAFLLGENYERRLVEDPGARCRLIREVLDLIVRNASEETRMLLRLRESGPSVPLYRLSVLTSERLLALQERLYGRLDGLRRDRGLVEATLRAYIPETLIDLVGLPDVRRILNGPGLAPYRDAILTKKLAALALYRHAEAWEDFLGRLEADWRGTLRGLVED